MDSFLKRKQKAPKKEITPAFQDSQQSLLAISIMSAVKRLEIIRTPCKAIVAGSHGLNALLRSDTFYSVVRIEFVTAELIQLIFHAVTEQFKIGATNEGQQIYAVLHNESLRISKLIVKYVNFCLAEMEGEASHFSARDKFNKKLDIKLWGPLEDYLTTHSNLPVVVAYHQSCMWVDDVLVSSSEVKAKLAEAKKEEVTYRTFDDLID